VGKVSDDRYEGLWLRFAHEVRDARQISGRPPARGMQARRRACRVDGVGTLLLHPVYVVNGREAACDVT